MRAAVIQFLAGVTLALTVLAVACLFHQPVQPVPKARCVLDSKEVR